MIKQGIKSKIMVAFSLLCVGCLTIAGVVRVSASTDSAMLSFATSGEVELDGVSDGQVTISLTAAQAGKLYVAQGSFSTTENDDSDHYFTASAFAPGSVIDGYSLDSSLSTGQFYYKYSQAGDGVNFGVGDHLYEMVYNVSADTPAGTYHLPINVEYVQQTSIDDYEEEVVVNATVTVTRNVAPVEKPTQVVTFRDSGGQPVSDLTYSYGSEDFEITKEVTSGDGLIYEYHPDDDGSGRVAHTVPNSDVVGLGEPGDVDICAWVSETDDYAETKACFTVHVVKRPITITGVAILDKTYDGTTDASVDNVTFSEIGNGAMPTYAVEASFDDANAGPDRTVRVDVALTGEALNRYELNSSSYETTKSIEPYLLTMENVAFADGHDSFMYDPDGVEPEVRVTANVFGGETTLVLGENYEVAYSDNIAAGIGHVLVNGVGNYTTGSDPLEVDFSILPQPITNDDVNAPNAIVEGHILTADEVSVNVNGRDLVRCENDGNTGCDYVLAISGNTGLLGDIVNVVVYGRNNYNGTGSKDIEVVAKLEQTVTIANVTNTVVEKSYGDDSFTYTAEGNGGGTISYRSTNESVITVDEYSGEVLIVGVGEADVIATAAETDTYAEGSARYTVRVNKRAISVEDVAVDNKIYDGTVAATVSDVTLSEGALVFGIDYTATALFNAPGVAVRDVDVTVTLTDDAFSHYCFSQDSECVNVTNYSTTASISAFELNEATTESSLSAYEFAYTGESIEPTATVRVDLDGDGSAETTLVLGTDYEVSFENNVNAGVATATVMGMGNYSGSISEMNYVIVPAVVTDVVVTAEAQDYTGEALEPALTVNGVVNGENVTFEAGDYEIVPHEEFVNAGDYTVTISSKDGSNYSIPTTGGVFTINKASSGNPPEMTADLKIVAGSTLAELGERTSGFAWANADAVVGIGEQTFEATYIRDNDSANYIESTVSVPVYGLKSISLATTPSDGGEVTGPGEAAVEGDELTWVITPADGYELLSLSVNLEDRTGEVSDGRFTMIAGADDITVTASFRRVYQFVDGMGQTHIRGVDGAAEFKVNADYELFEDDGVVLVDGELLDPEYYDSRSGSTVILLSAEYLDTLALGEHTLAVLFSDDGIARTTFNVAEPEADNPAAADTGVFTGEGAGAIMTGASLAAIGAMAGLVYGVKRWNKKA